MELVAKPVWGPRASTHADRGAPLRRTLIEECDRLLEEARSSVDL